MVVKIIIAIMVLSNEEKIFIKALLLRGYKVSEILEFPGNNFKKSTVYDFARKFRETGATERRQGSGRPRTVRTRVGVMFYYWYFLYSWNNLLPTYHKQFKNYYYFRTTSNRWLC